MSYKPVYAFGVFSLLFLLNCHTRPSDYTLNDLRSGLTRPPNGVRIAENLFIDRTEVSNLDWREYTFWVQRVDPDALHAVLPDTNVWHYAGGADIKYLSEHYFRHAAYDPFPVVGISQAQARAYCSWRSDRVYENILIDLGRIPANKDQHGENSFTAERYLSGAYMGIRPDSTVPVPRYRLPTEAEWEQAARCGRDLAAFPFGYEFSGKKWQKEQGEARKAAAFNTRESLLHIAPGSWTDANDKMTASGEAGVKNDFGLFQMLGNVSEMTDQPGIAKGGNYQTPFDECRVRARQTYGGPDHVTGFRCVCSWEMPK